jgi:hypothetical protein
MLALLLLFPQRQPKRGNICRRIKWQKLPRAIRLLSRHPVSCSLPSGNRKNKLVSSIPRANSHDLRQSRADRPNLGGLIADGFIAVEAKDGQQVKNIGSDIMKLGKALE